MTPRRRQGRDMSKQAELTGVAEEGWTVETLKAYFEALLKELRTHIDQRFLDVEKSGEKALAAAEKAVNAAFASAESAVAKEAENAALWRANANEWRSTMTDREQRFAAKPEVEAEFKSVRAELQSLKESRAEGVGSKTVIAAVLSTAVAALLMWAGFHFGK